VLTPQSDDAEKLSGWPSAGSAPVALEACAIAVGSSDQFSRTGSGAVASSASDRQCDSERETMPRKTVLVSDQSGAEIPEGKGATVRITFRDARKGVRELDLTDAKAEKLGGRSVARRGRRPKAAS
jgi:hypothetical protein